MEPLAPSPLAQRIYDSLLRLDSRRFTHDLTFRLLQRVRQRLIARGDPLIRYRLAGADLLLPISHELPMTRKHYPRYAENLARIAAHVHRSCGDLAIIDIGANVGDSVALLRAVTECPILCIEGHPRYAAIFRANAQRNCWQNVELVQIFIGTGSGTMPGRFVTHKGTANLVGDSPEGETIRLQRLDEVLAEHGAFSRAKLLKIDTDGLDCKILRSDPALLARLKPVLFFEYFPARVPNPAASDEMQIFATLRDTGYIQVLVFEESGEYAYSVRLDNPALLEDLYHFYAGRRDGRYADLCAFHAEDAGLCAAVRQAEIAFRESLRRAETNRHDAG